jgi:hypothetical protein
MSGKTVNLTRNRRLKELQGMAGYMAERLANKVPPCKVVEVDGHKITALWYSSPESAIMYKTLAISSPCDDWRAITALGPMGSTANIDGLEIPVADEDTFLFFALNIKEIMKEFGVKEG